MSPPLFVGPLTRMERVTVEKLQGKPPRFAVGLRAQAMRRSAQRRTAPQIGEIVGNGRSTVLRWMQAFNQRGLDSLSPGKSPGAPPKADAEYPAAVVEVLRHNPKERGYAFTCWTVALLIEHLFRQTRVRIGHTTMGGLLHQLNCRYGQPKLDLRHRQDLREVARARRQKARAFKKTKADAGRWAFAYVDET